MEMNIEGVNYQHYVVIIMWSDVHLIIQCKWKYGCEHKKKLLVIFEKYIQEEY